MVQYLRLGPLQMQWSPTRQGLQKKAEILSSKCAVTRRLLEPTKESVAHSKTHSFYTSCNNPSAFAGRNALKRASNAVTGKWTTT